MEQSAIARNEYPLAQDKVRYWGVAVAAVDAKTAPRGRRAIHYFTLK